MRHLTWEEIEAFREDASVTPQVREHFTHCELCQQRAADGQRVERALTQVGRVEHAPDLSTRIIAALPSEARQNAFVNPWLGVITLFAAMLGFALAFQTAVTLRANGAFELVSYYTMQPEIVTTYPGEAWGALAAAVPWMTVGIGVAMLAIALVLTVRWTSSTARLAR